MTPLDLVSQKQGQLLPNIEGRRIDNEILHKIIALPVRDAALGQAALDGCQQADRHGVAQFEVIGRVALAEREESFEDITVRHRVLLHGQSPLHSKRIGRPSASAIRFASSTLMRSSAA